MIELTQYEFGEAFYDKHRLKTRSFFDDYLIDTENTTVETRLCKPVEKEVVLKLDKPIGFEEDLSTFSGKEVTMTVRMRDADLYSVQFSKERG